MTEETDNLDLDVLLKTRDGLGGIAGRLEQVGA